MQTVTLNDGRKLALSSDLEGDDPEDAKLMVIVDDEGNGEEFPGVDSEIDGQEIFRTLQSYERTLALLIEAGHVNKTQVDAARKMAGWK